MKKNMGTPDRIIRTILAGAFIVLYVTGTVTGVIGIILLVLAAIFILTSWFGFCPAYYIAKINTLMKSKPKDTGNQVHLQH